MFALRRIEYLNEEFVHIDSGPAPRRLDTEPLADSLLPSRDTLIDSSNSAKEVLKRS